MADGAVGELLADAGVRFAYLFGSLDLVDFDFLPGRREHRDACLRRAAAEGLHG